MAINWRLLTEAEKALAAKLIAASSLGNRLMPDLSQVQVRPPLDWGLGGHIFQSDNPVTDRRFGGWVCEAIFDDVDGVLVSIALDVDQFGDLFELDIWKVDFTQLVRFPRPDEVRIVRNFMT